MPTFRLYMMSLAVFMMAAQPSSAQERQWLLDAAEEDAFLIYGVPDTNDVGVSFWCKLGSKKASVFTSLRGVKSPTDKLSLELRLGSKNFRLDATLNAENQPPSVEAELLPLDQIRQALKESESIALTVLGHTSVYPLTDSDLDGLFTLCNQPLQSAE